MKITIDNVKKENYECFNYPNKEFKKIDISNIKYNKLGKDIKIEFDNNNEAESFIYELINENGITKEDLIYLLGEEYFK